MELKLTILGAFLFFIILTTVSRYIIKNNLTKGSNETVTLCKYYKLKKEYDILKEQKEKWINRFEIMNKQNERVLTTMRVVYKEGKLPVYLKKRIKKHL